MTAGEGAIAPPQAPLGRLVANRWRLVRLLGIGGTATVYEAHHRNGRKAAVKVLHPHVASHRVARERFLSEGYAANKIDHPNAVLVLDDGEDGDLVFLVMELLSGWSLSERLAQEGPLPWPVVVGIAAAVLDVLAAAHDRGVVHRDIKPGNIFELDTGGIKVLDFGAAKVQVADPAVITRTGATVGTPAFMAPEQAGGRPEDIDALTDVWAVGATMSQLLTGRHLHEATTPNAALVAAATKQVSPIRERLPELPPAVAAVIDRALAFDRERRWPNARAMHAALAAAVPISIDALAQPLDSPTLPETRGPGVAAPTTHARSARARIGLMIAAVAAIAGLTGAAMLRSRRTAPLAAPASAVEAARGVTTAFTPPAPARAPLPDAPPPPAVAEVPPAPEPTLEASHPSGSTAARRPASSRRASSGDAHVSARRIPDKKSSDNSSDDELIDTRH